MLKAEIPGGVVVGGNARDCKKLSDLDSAVAYFAERAPRGTEIFLHEEGA